MIAGSARHRSWSVITDCDTLSMQSENSERRVDIACNCGGLKSTVAVIPQ